MVSVAFEFVHKVYRQNRFFLFENPSRTTYALRQVSFSVERGEVLGLLGPNGSGKSTTLKLISTILLPDSGRILIQGHETRREGQKVRRDVGFALASERSFFPRLTVRENLEFFAALEDVPHREIPERIAQALRAVELIYAADKQAMKLSSGMYQRLAIARAIVKNPAVLLLDEPTRSLDLTSATELRRLISELATRGTTIVLATHSFEEATSVCNRVALLNKGELMAEQEVGGLSSHNIEELYREMTCEQPRSTELLRVTA